MCGNHNLHFTDDGAFELCNICYCESTAILIRQPSSHHGACNILTCSSFLKEVVWCGIMQKCISPTLYGPIQSGIQNFEMWLLLEWKKPSSHGVRNILTCSHRTVHNSRPTHKETWCYSCTRPFVLFRVFPIFADLPPNFSP